jgi:hypothetical protein
LGGGRIVFGWRLVLGDINVEIVERGIWGFVLMRFIGGKEKVRLVLMEYNLGLRRG